MTAGRIVIGHANHPGVTKVYGQLVEIIRSRKLVPVHLGDVFDV
jgi:peptidoglycan-N-acetylglucosamine deacetylase